MIEKILERLEEEREYSYANFEEYVNETDADLDAEYDDLFHRGLERAKKIVRQVAREYSAVVKENLTSEKNGGWIPCSERLPEGIMKDCLVTLKNGAVFQAQYVKYRKEFRIVAPYHGIIRFHEDNPVIAWCELPAPYQKGE